MSATELRDVPGLLAAGLAQELVRLTVQLSELAHDLSSDPATLRRHIVSLQAIDSITQTQLCLAEVLRAHGTVTERLDAITLDDVAERLRRSVG